MWCPSSSGEYAPVAGRVHPPKVLLLAVAVVTAVSTGVLFVLPRCWERPVPIPQIHTMAKQFVASQADEPPWPLLPPDCRVYGPASGLFEPDTPHPRIIVTGGAGLIGSSLVHRLQSGLQAGQVKVIDNLRSGSLRNLRSGSTVHNDTSWVIRPTRDFCAADLRAAAVADELLRGADTVFHLAGVLGGPNSDSVFHDNVLIDTHVLHAAQAHGVSHFVYVGGDKPGKDVGEKLAGLARGPAFHVGIARVTYVYGPRSEFRGPSAALIPALIRTAIEAETGLLPVQGSARRLHDFVHVDDVVEALIRIEKKGMDQGPIEIGSGQAITTVSLAQAVTDLARLRLNKTLTVSFAAESKPSVARPVAVLDRAHAVLGWSPAVSLTDGLADLMSWIESAMAVPRVLVIQIGNQRGSEFAWRSLHRHLLSPYSADLAIFSTEGAPRTLLHLMAQYEWRIPDYGDDWSAVFDAAARRCRPESEIHAWHRLCQIKDCFLGSLSPCSDHSSSAGILWSYRWLTQQNLQRFNLLDKYDIIALTRTDHLYLCDHFPFAQMQPGIAYLADGEGWGGYSDRHLVAAPDVFMKMINLTNEFVCDTDRVFNLLCSNNQSWNIERVQKALWDSRGLTVVEFPRSMLTVRAEGDPTRWSPGEFDPVMGRFGLKVKYPDEYQLARHHCSVKDDDILTDLGRYCPISNISM